MPRITRDRSVNINMAKERVSTNEPEDDEPYTAGGLSICAGCRYIYHCSEPDYEDVECPCDEDK
jgi:hypothetical protein